MVAALVALVLGVWEHTTGVAVSPFLFLVVSVLLFWVGAYQAWAKKRSELLAEQDKHSGPDISATWGLPNHAGLLGLKPTLLIENNGEMAAFSVRVDPIQLHGIAKFEPLYEMKGKTRSPAPMLGGDGDPYAGNFYTFLGDSDNQKAARARGYYVDDPTGATIYRRYCWRLPIRVTYKDSAGSAYFTDSTLLVDWFSLDGAAEPRGRGRL